jgi:hypothetical protein
VEPHPDRLEKGVRFGCGFLFGCFAALGALLTSVSGAYPVAALCVLTGVVIGYAAMRFGDRFWWWLSSWLRPWWW